MQTVLYLAFAPCDTYTIWKKQDSFRYWDVMDKGNPTITG